MLPIRTILHPTDFSECSVSAFRIACSLAHDYGASLVVMHVAEPEFVYSGLIAGPTPDTHRILHREHHA